MKINLSVSLVIKEPSSSLYWVLTSENRFSMIMKPETWNMKPKPRSWDLLTIKSELENFKYFKKELSLCHKLKFSNPYIFTTGWRRPLIFQTYIIWSNRIHSLKYLRSTTLGCKDIRIRKFEFVLQNCINNHMVFIYLYFS